MNRPQPNKEKADLTALDRILSSDDQLTPSSGFLDSVMELVQEEARVPAPFPFPWKRAIPGIALACGVLGWSAFEFLRQAIPAARQLSFAHFQMPVAIEHPAEQVAWVALALAASFASWLLSRRIAGLSGLL